MSWSERFSNHVRKEWRERKGEGNQDIVKSQLTFSVIHPFSNSIILWHFIKPNIPHPSSPLTMTSLPPLWWTHVMELCLDLCILFWSRSKAWAPASPQKPFESDIISAGLDQSDNDALISVLGNIRMKCKRIPMEMNDHYKKQFSWFFPLLFCESGRRFVWIKKNL